MFVAYIVEVGFKFGGAQNWQSVAEGVCFSKDLVVKRNLSCGTQRQTGNQLKRQNRGEMMLSQQN